MSTALYPLRKLQMGLESTAGTRVAATRVVVGDWEVDEQQDRYFSNYPRGIRGPRGGSGSVIKRWVDIKGKTELTPQEILWALQTGVKSVASGVAGSGGDSDAKTWTFDFNNTAAPTLKSATAEWVETDGTTNHRIVESGFVTCAKLGLEIPAEGAAMMNLELFGRARQSDTPTGSLAPYTNRDTAIMAGPSSGVYLDSAWADIGDTLFPGVIRSTNLNFDFGLKQNYGLGFRTDRDWVNARHGEPKFGGQLVAELDADGATRLSNWRSGTIEFMRVKTVAGNVGASAIPYTVQVDMPIRWLQPSFANQDDYILATLPFEPLYDVTDGETLVFTVINDLAAIANM